MLVGVLLLAAIGFAALRLVQAQGAATAGRDALLSAQAALEARDVPAAEGHLRQARTGFTTARRHLQGGGPALALARATPLVRVQLRAAIDLARTGEVTAGSGVALMPTARQLLGSGGAEDGLDALAAAQPEVERAVGALEQAQQRMLDLQGYRLLGPLDGQHRAALDRLESAVELARRGQAGVTVLLELAGATGDRRFLLLSQNPDEPRPTGGFMGTYGLATARGGKARIERYGDTQLWRRTHPQAVVPAAQAGYPFRYVSQDQHLGNSSTTPDWPTTARTAVRIWRSGGEPDVDGVVTFTPRLVERLLAVLGTVQVPGYPEPVTAGTVDALLEKYVHSQESRGRADRKDFVGDLAVVVLERSLDAPGSQLPDLLRALDTTMTRAEAAVWSARPPVQEALGVLGWDGALPETTGDFYADAAYALASKNGRSLLRTYDHVVRLRPDGSGTAATTTVVRNPRPLDRYANPGAPHYVTPYGPAGAVLADGSDPPDGAEPDVAGHPSAGWLRLAPPLGQSRLHVVWDAPVLAVPLSDGTWEYRLHWRPLAGHRGDVLRLQVELPAGWDWLGAAPPAQVELDGPFTGRWLLSPAT